MVTQYDKAFAAVIVGLLGYFASTYHLFALTPEGWVALTGLIETVAVYLIPNKAV